MQIRAGKVDDFASKQLSSIRKELDNLCLPVKSEYRPKIDGKVMDKSSTGSTFFIEPVAAGKYYDDISLLKIEEENEVLRICYVLTAAILDKEQAILDNIRTIEKLDFAFSKGKLSIDYNGIEPYNHRTKHRGQNSNNKNSWTPLSYGSMWTSCTMSGS